MDEDRASELRADLYFALGMALGALAGAARAVDTPGYGETIRRVLEQLHAERDYLVEGAVDRHRQEG